VTAIVAVRAPRAPRAVRWSAPLAVLAALVVWELVGVSGIAGEGTVPAFHDVLHQLWIDRSLYPSNIGQTVREALLGFLIGNTVAIALAFLFVVAGPAERALTGLMVVLYATPPIVAAPVLAVAFDAGTAKVTLSALMVVFPTLVNTLLGLRSVDRAAVDLIEVYGGNRFTVLRRARARAALPSIAIGLRIAAPAALLGAIIGEFLGGTSGLGVFMLNSLAQFNAPRTWGAGLVATLLASSVFFLFMLLGRRLAVSNAAPTVGLGPAVVAVRGTPLKRAAIALGQFALSAAVVILAWYAFVDGLGLDPLFAKTPGDVLRTITTGPEAHRIWAALGHTTPLALAGLVGGLLAASLGAILFVLLPSVERATLPLALVLQSVPLVAMAPVLITIFGRGPTVTVVVSTIVTFFPSLVTIAEGLRTVPSASLDVLDVYGASPVTAMWRVRVPYAIPAFLAAARLVAPLALLGVMIAEWLATGTGLGGDLQNARFQLEFDVVWAEAAVATAFAVAAYLLIGAAERVASRRFGTAGGRG
jgi:sulfonate transport system permease protein